MAVEKAMRLTLESEYLTNLNKLGLHSAWTYEERFQF